MLHRQVVPKVKELIQDTSQTLTLLVTQHGDKTLCEPTLLRAFAKGLQTEVSYLLAYVSQG